MTLDEGKLKLIAHFEGVLTKAQIGGYMKEKNLVYTVAHHDEIVEAIRVHHIATIAAVDKMLPGAASSTPAS